MSIDDKIGDRTDYTRGKMGIRPVWVLDHRIDAHEDGLLVEDQVVREHLYRKEDGEVHQFCHCLKLPAWS